MEKAQVLIVEDDSIIAMDIESQMKRLGYGVTGVVAYGEDVIEKIKANKPDVVLMDIVLKGEVDGIDAADQIRTQFNIPVIFLTAHADKERLERAKLTYPFGFILKPFHNKELEVTIEMALYIAKVDADRKQAEQVLRESEERYRSLAENINLGVTMIDADHNIVMTNAAQGLLFGKSVSEFIGKKCFKEFEKREAVCPHCPGTQAMHTGQPAEVETAGVRDDGTRFNVRIQAFPVFQQDGVASGFIELVEDITEKKKIKAQLQQAQKMESIVTLAGGIAHDFNNALFPIMGFAEMALDDVPKDSPLRDNIKEIIQGVERAGDLVKQIFAFSRQSGQELKPLKVQLIIKEVLKLIRTSIPTTIEINQDISAKCGYVLADPTQIHQIAMNLMTNAYHAMEHEGGKMEVTFKEVVLQVEDFGLSPGTYACLTVTDTGIGMDKSAIDHIFEPYFTTKENGKDTGLGLATVHGIVKSYHGDIRVYSKPGEGTAFHVYLPVIEFPFETEETEAIEPVTRGTEQILLVEIKK